MKKTLLALGAALAVTTTTAGAATAAAPGVDPVKHVVSVSDARGDVQVFKADKRARTIDVSGVTYSAVKKYAFDGSAGLKISVRRASDTPKHPAMQHFTTTLATETGDFLVKVDVGRVRVFKLSENGNKQVPLDAWETMSTPTTFSAALSAKALGNPKTVTELQTEMVFAARQALDLTKVTTTPLSMTFRK